MDLNTLLKRSNASHVIHVTDAVIKHQAMATDHKVKTQPTKDKNQLMLLVIQLMVMPMVIIQEAIVHVVLSDVVNIVKNNNVMVVSQMEVIKMIQLTLITVN